MSGVKYETQFTRSLLKRVHGRQWHENVATFDVSTITKKWLTLSFDPELYFIKNREFVTINILISQGLNMP